MTLRIDPIMFKVFKMHSLLQRFQQIRDAGTDTENSHPEDHAFISLFLK